MNIVPIEPPWIRGAVSCERTAYGLLPWRLPDDRPLLHHAGIVSQAGIPAGVRVAFATDADRVALRVQAGETSRGFDLVIEDRLEQSVELPAGEATVAFTLPAGRKRAEIYLPHRHSVALQSLAVDDGAAIAPWSQPDSRPKWTVYGSSITQCGAAASPAQTWPAIVARSRGWDLTCLGFGGQCHLEPTMAQLIRDVPADIVTLCLGINVYGAGSLSLRTFRAAAIGMIAIIREKQPHTELLVMSPLYAPDRETTNNAAGFNLVLIREELREAVAIMRGYGDERLHYIDGLDLFDASCGVHLSDRLHPNAEGYRLLADRLLQHPVFAAAAAQLTTSQ